jgi:hypothetical protein
MRHVVFADTMIHLHYKPVDDIDWRALVGAVAGDEVAIAVAGITLQELDRHAHQHENPTLRDRAKRAARRLADGLAGGTGVLREDVGIVDALMAPTLDYDAVGLDRQWPDDRLVATILEWHRRHPDDRVVLVSRDTYPGARVRGLGMDAIMPPDSLRLPSTDPQESQIRALEREVARLKSAHPKILMQFVDSDEPKLDVGMSDPGELTDAELDDAVSRADARLPRALPVESASAEPEADGEDLKIAGLDFEALRVASEHIEIRNEARYEAERTTYLRAYRDFARRHHHWRRAKAFMVEVGLEIVNSGTATADDTDVVLEVPGDVMVWLSDGLPSAPQPPDPPIPPERFGSIGRTSATSGVVQPSLGYPPQPPSNVSSFWLRRGSESELSCTVKSIKHGFIAVLDKFYVGFPDAASLRAFEIRYMMQPSNLPDPVTGRLAIVATLQ